MLPKINGKSFLECTEEDLEVLIDNPDFRENEYIEYKQGFSFLDEPKGKNRNEKIAEFKNDVCAFANAEGGYLIFGISDENGCANKIIGVDIPENNTDKFELDRRNNLAAISPKIPYMSYHFVGLKNEKFVVIIYVKHDNFAPYVHIQDEKNYKIYKRIGNGKKTMTYTELKNMFNQSLSLDNEIYNYRKERIDYYNSQNKIDENEHSRFMLLHIIPETFMDSSYFKNMFILEKTKNINFSSIFSEFGCSSTSIPCVDGLRFIARSQYTPQSECYVNNNGIVECFLTLTTELHMNDSRYPNGFFPWKYIWEMIADTYSKYVKVFEKIYAGEKVFVCISIVGCKGVTSQSPGLSFRGTVTIDRDIVICAPVGIDNLSDGYESELVLKKLYIEYLLAMGIRGDKYLNEFIEELYGN